MQQEEERENSTRKIYKKKNRTAKIKTANSNRVKTWGGGRGEGKGGRALANATMQVWRTK
jgi:hypothetical protein